jgi:hypothetical protein
MGQKCIIGGGPVELLLGNGAQHQHWIMIGLLPQFAIKPAEQLDGLQLPAPEQIIGNLPQRFKAIG